MTEALRRAFGAASRLPDKDQEELATAILEELAADQWWETAFTASQAVLGRLADEAVTEHRARQTKRLDPDVL